MILSFKEQFKKKILNGRKIHTIREDKLGRWKAGNIIQAATGVRTKNYNCFFESVCLSTQSIKIEWINETHFTIHIDDNLKVSVFLNDKCQFLVNDISFNPFEFLINDGFSSIEDFCNWFSEDFIGKIIHWTDKKY